MQMNLNWSCLMSMFNNVVVASTGYFCQTFGSQNVQLTIRNWKQYILSWAINNFMICSNVFMNLIDIFSILFWKLVGEHDCCICDWNVTVCLQNWC